MSSLKRLAFGVLLLIPVSTALAAQVVPSEPDQSRIAALQLESPSATVVREARSGSGLEGKEKLSTIDIGQSLITSVQGTEDLDDDGVWEICLACAVAAVGLAICCAAELALWCAEHPITCAELVIECAKACDSWLGGGSQ